MLPNKLFYQNIKQGNKVVLRWFFGGFNIYFHLIGKYKKIDLYVDLN